jgi:hypothetical protein
VELPIGVLVAAATENCCDELRFMPTGDAGFMLTPTGNPAIATDTVPLNPFVPVTETVSTAVAQPCETLRDDGLTEIEKSGGIAVTVRLSEALWLRFPLVP